MNIESSTHTAAALRVVVVVGGGKKKGWILHAPDRLHWREGEGWGERSENVFLPLSLSRLSLLTPSSKPSLFFPRRRIAQIFCFLSSILWSFSYCHMPAAAANARAAFIGKVLPAKRTTSNKAGNLGLKRGLKESLKVAKKCPCCAHALMADILPSIPM